MERALLEGEHQTEMERLQSDQENIARLKQRQSQLLEVAARRRQSVSCVCFWGQSFSLFALV